MAVRCREAPYRQALPQPIEQLAQRRLLPVRIGADRADAVLPGDETIGLVRLQGDPLEAEIRLQLLQHLREQPPQVRWRPRRQAGADRQLLHVAVHPERPQCHLPGAPTCLYQNLTKLIEQPIHRPVDAGTGDDRVDEVARHAELRRRTYRYHRSPPVAPDRIQRVQQHPAEAPGQWCTGLAQRVADALQAKPVQPSQAVGRQPQHRQRQALHQHAISAGRNDQAVLPGAGQRRRSVCDVGDNGAGRNAAARQSGADLCHQRCLTAEQLDAAGDVEHQSVRRIDRRLWSEAQPPECQPLQQSEVCFRLRRAKHQARIHGLGVGQRLPGV